MRCDLVTIRSKRNFSSTASTTKLPCFSGRRERERKKTLWELRSGDLKTSQLSSFVTRELYKYVFRVQMPLPSGNIFVTDILRESQSDPERREERERRTETTVIKYLVQHQCLILTTSDRFFFPFRGDMHAPSLPEQASTPVTVASSRKSEENRRQGLRQKVLLAESCLCPDGLFHDSDEITGGCCNCEWKFSLLRVTLEW